MSLAVGGKLRVLSSTFPQTTLTGLSRAIDVENDHPWVSNEYVAGFKV